MRSMLFLALAAALAASALGTWAYLAPETGVSGTSGALLALVGAIAVALAILILLRSGPGRWRGVLIALAVLGGGLTAVAAWFLMQWAFAAVALAAALLVPLAASRRAAA